MRKLSFLSFFKFRCFCFLVYLDAFVHLWLKLQPAQPQLVFISSVQLQLYFFLGEEEFESFLKLNSAKIERSTWSCYLCGKITNKSSHMRQHFEAFHYSLGQMQCEVCQKTFKTRHSLATHVSKNHRNHENIYSNWLVWYNKQGRLNLDQKPTQVGFVYVGFIYSKSVNDGGWN